MTTSETLNTPGNKESIGTNTEDERRNGPAQLKESHITLSQNPSPSKPHNQLKIADSTPKIHQICIDEQELITSMINESHKKDSEIHSDFNEEIQKEIQQDLLDD